MRVGSAVAAALVLFAVSSIAQLIWVARWKPAPNHIDAAWASLAAASARASAACLGHLRRALLRPGLRAPRPRPQPAQLRRPPRREHRIHRHSARRLPHGQNHSVAAHRQDRRRHPLQLPQSPLGPSRKRVRLGAHRWSADRLRGCRAKRLAHRRCRLVQPLLRHLLRRYPELLLDQSRHVRRPDGPGRSLLDQRLHPAGAGRPRTQIARSRRPPSLLIRRSPPLPSPRPTCNSMPSNCCIPIRRTSSSSISPSRTVPTSGAASTDNYTQSCDSSYLDNLALTDRVLGQLLATLKASPRWSNTTLIVQGDHGWRIDAWNWLPAWTEEDDAASRGVFDQRPALLIHQPGQNQPQTVASPWPIIQVHGVVEQVVRGQHPAF